MIGYLKINKIVIPYHCLESAYEHMRLVGKQNLEGVALFAGREGDSTFEVLQTIIPAQKAMNLEEGLLYAVDGEELHRINVWLYENKMNLIAQIHSHPGRAYHSLTDDEYPIVATIGGISIVVPDFAEREIAIKTWAVYRLSSKNKWEELDVYEKTELINITA